MKRKNLILSIACTMLVLLVAGSVFCFSGCNKQDEIEYKWEVYFSFFYMERVDGGNLGAQAILNDENRESHINTLAMDKYTYIDIDALKYLYVNGEKGSNIERRNGLDLLKNSNFMKYSYTGSDTNVVDNLATVLTPPQFLTPEEGYLYLKLDEGSHEFNFDFNLGSKNSDKLKYKVVVNVTNERKDGLEIKFASNYLKKYSAEETGDYDLYVVDSIPYFNFSLNGVDIGTYNYPVSTMTRPGFFNEDDRIRFSMIAYKIVNGEFKSFGVNEIVQKGLYYVEVDARDSREYKSVVYKCYVFMA